MGDSIRSLLRRTSSCHLPWQISAGLALGVLCGLLPKFSLLFCVVAVLCCGLPIHLPLAAVSCFIFAFAAGPLTQAAGRTGLWSLTNPSLIDMWSSLDGLPWLPWFGLNNSVVHGSLLLGLGIALPVFFLTKPLAVRLSPARRDKLEQALDPAFTHELKPAVAVDWSGSSELSVRSHPISVSVVNEDTCRELEKLLATCNAGQAHNAAPQQVAQRAAQMVQYVDELLASPDFQLTPSTAQSPVGVAAVDVHPDEIRPQAAALFNTQPAGQVSTSLDSTGGAQFNCQPTTHELGTARDAIDSSGKIHAAGAALHRHSSAAEVAMRSAVGDANQAETLRYLLEHLRAIKDKV